jgi:hypothetical protein
MDFNFDEIKKHPYVIGGIVIAGGLGLFLIMRGGGGGSAAAQGTGIDPTLAALYQSQAAEQGQQQQDSAELDAAQIQANTTGQANQLTAGVDLAQIQATSGSTNLQTTTQGNVDEDQIAEQLGVANDQLTLGTTTAGDALAGLESTNQSNVNMTALQASEQEQIASQNDAATASETATLGSVELGIAGDNASIAKAAIGSSSTGSIIGGVGALAAAFI